MFSASKPAPPPGSPAGLIGFKGSRVNGPAGGVSTGMGGGIVGPDCQNTYTPMYLILEFQVS